MYKVPRISNDLDYLRWYDVRIGIELGFKYGLLIPLIYCLPILIATSCILILMIDLLITALNMIGISVIVGVFTGSFIALLAIIRKSTLTFKNLMIYAELWAVVLTLVLHGMFYSTFASLFSYMLWLGIPSIIYLGITRRLTRRLYEELQGESIEREWKAEKTKP